MAEEYDNPSYIQEKGDVKPLYNEPFPNVPNYVGSHGDDDGGVEPIVQIFPEEENNSSANDVLCPLGIPENNSIQPGWFVGGGISELIEPGTINSAPNRKVWLRVTWTTTDEDDVLQAGGTAGTVTVQSGTDVPDDIVPTLLSLSGTAFIPLGGWDSNEDWEPNGCGTVTLSFCPGGFIKGRQG